MKICKGENYKHHYLTFFIIWSRCTSHLTWVYCPNYHMLLYEIFFYLNFYKLRWMVHSTSYRIMILRLFLRLHQFIEFQNYTYESLFNKNMLSFQYCSNIFQSKMFFGCQVRFTCQVSFKDFLWTISITQYALLFPPLFSHGVFRSERLQ